MTTKQLTRRNLLKLASASAIGGALAACAPRAAAPAPDEKAAEEATQPAAAAAPGMKTVRMYAQGLTPRGRLETERWDPPKMMDVLKEQYEEAHANTTIEFVPEMQQGYEEWLVTQMSGGTSPEIVWYQRGYIARDYQKNWFANLDPALAAPNQYVPGNKAWKDIFQGPVIASGIAPDGHIYMITGDIVGTGLFYNKTMFDTVGVKVPETWSEFIKVQQALKDAKITPVSMSMDLAGGVQLYGSWSTRIIQDVMYDKKMSYVKGTTDPVPRTWKPGENLPPQVMVPAIRAGRYSAKDPEWLEMLNVLKGWSQFWNDGFWAVAPTDVYPLWAKKQAAMTWQGSWMNKPIRNDPLVDFEWGIFPKIPTITEAASPFGGADFPAMAGVGGVFQYAVATESDKRGVMEETLDWMRYITAPKNLIALLNDHGGFAPGTVDTTGADPSLSVYTEMMVQYGTERIEPFDSMLSRQFVDTMWNQLQQFLAGQISADVMADTIQKEMVAAADLLASEHPDWK